MSDWRLTTLQEIISTIESGSRPKGGVRIGENSEGIPSYGGENISINGDLLYDSVRMVPVSFAAEMRKGVLSDKDVLINKDGANTGKSAIYRRPAGEKLATINEHIFLLRCKKNTADQEFLYHFLNSEIGRSQIAKVITGSAQPGLNSTFPDFVRIDLPPLPEQKKIAEILSGIDKAISIKRIRHERRLIAANLIFESLLSNIECRQAALSQIAHLERGKFSHRPRNDPAYYGGLYPFIQTGDIPKTGVAIREHKQTLNEKGLKVSRQFPAGTLVITIAATIGEVGILSCPACFPDSLVGIDPHKDKCDPVYLLFLLRRLKNTLLQMAPQSAQSNLNLEILGKLSVPLPSLPDQQRFSRMITCEDKRASAEDIEIMKLQYLKTAVANDLLSGRKRVTL